MKIGKVELITVAPRNWSLQEDGSILEMAINWGTYGQGTVPEHDVDLEFDIHNVGIFVCNELSTIEIDKQVSDNSIVLTNFCTLSKCFIRIYNESKWEGTKEIPFTQVSGFKKVFGTLEEFDSKMKELGLEIPEKKNEKKQIVGN